MNTIEGNNDIAKFMGFELTRYGYWMSEKTPTGSIAGWYKPNEMKYHSSWDWLMPVVEKINRWHINNLCEKMDFYLFQQSITSSIDMVWDGCVQFIQWYNENKIK